MPNVTKVNSNLGLDNVYVHILGTEYDSGLSFVQAGYTGMSIKDYLTDYRISVAKKLLSDQSNSVHEASLKSGFADPFYFSRLFKKSVGLSPTNYRKKLHYALTQIVQPNQPREEKHEPL